MKHVSYAEQGLYTPQTLQAPSSDRVFDDDRRRQPTAFLRRISKERSAKWARELNAIKAGRSGAGAHSACRTPLFPESASTPPATSTGPCLAWPDFNDPEGISMTAARLQRYFDDNGLTEGARSCITMIRESAQAWQGPTVTRGLNGADKRTAGYAEVPAVDSRWASALAANGNVLEVYYQPPRLPSSAVPPVNVSAPYFFVLWVDQAGWADCQTEADLKRMALQQPERYCRDASGHWRSPIGEAFARLLGFCYRVLTPAQVFGRLAADDFHARPSSCDGVRRSQARAAAGHNHDNEA